MNELLIWLGRLGGLAGVLLGVLAVGARFMGHWHIGDVQVGTLLLASIGALALGAFGYAAALAERGRA